MIKFFRKIRQRLLSENRFSKYFIYALGEIFLVVIGIMIALQVNNWNEARKNHDQQKVALLVIKDEMKSNLKALTIGKEKLSDKLEVQRQLLAVMDTAVNTINEAELSSLIASATNFSTKFHYENGALLELISSGGLKKIENSKIRNSLASFDGKIKKVQKQEKAVNDEYDKANDYIEKHGDFRGIFDETGASNWIKIKKSVNNNSNRPLLETQEFENIIVIMLASGLWLHDGLYNELETVINEFIEQIDKELEIDS